MICYLLVFWGIVFCHGEPSLGLVFLIWRDCPAQDERYKDDETLNYCWWKNPANQLRLVIYPIIYRVFKFQVVSRISAISGMTLIETKSSPLKMDDWKMTFSLEMVDFQGQTVGFKGVFLELRVSSMSQATSPEGFSSQGGLFLKWPDDCGILEVGDT